MAKAVFSRKNGGKAIVFYVFVRKSGGTPRNFGGKNYFFIVLHKKPREIKLVFKRLHKICGKPGFYRVKLVSGINVFVNRLYSIHFVFGVYFRVEKSNVIIFT